MISVSNDFKSAMQAPVKVLGAEIAVAGGSTYTAADFLTKAEILCSGYYFGVATKALTFVLLGTTYSLLGAEVNVTLKVLTDAENDDWESCDLGHYQIVEQTVDLEKGMTTLKAYDAVGIAALNQYSVGELNFPCTVDALAVQVASASNMNYDEGTLVNGTYTIQEDLYALLSNVTHRDILAEIAGASASLAIVTGSNSALSFRNPLQTAQETLTYANLKKVKLEPMYGTVNRVVLARTPQEDNVVVSDPGVTDENACAVKLANNEILDDDRESLAQPILDAVSGFGFYPFTATTEGHGWYEIGDRLAVTDGVSTWDVIITEIKLTIDGGLKEELKGVAPTEETTNYALAGGITKTIYNTEIKVDKQSQEITSIVSRQEEFEGQTLANFSQVSQNINSVVTTIQTTGGGNLIHNSVGYNKNTNGTLVSWTTTGTATSESSPESISHGALSGNQIDLAASSSIRQEINVDTTGSVYTLSFRAKKSEFGTATITFEPATPIVGDPDGVYSVEIPAGEAITWQEYTIESMAPLTSPMAVTVTTDGSVSEFAITDLMLTIGDSRTPWVSASDEIMSKSVAIDSDGVKVSSNTTQDYVKLDELGLNGYSDASGSLQNVFTINRDLTEVAKLKARQQMEMPPLKIVPITSGSKTGWAWVKIS